MLDLLIRDSIYRSNIKWHTNTFFTRMTLLKRINLLLVCFCSRIISSWFLFFQLTALQYYYSVFTLHLHEPPKKYEIRKLEGFKLELYYHSLIFYFCYPNNVLGSSTSTHKFVYPFHSAPKRSNFLWALSIESVTEATPMTNGENEKLCKRNSINYQTLCIRSEGSFTSIPTAQFYLFASIP